MHLDISIRENFGLDGSLTLPLLIISKVKNAMTFTLFYRYLMGKLRNPYSSRNSKNSKIEILNTEEFKENQILTVSLQQSN
jgi:hypothetical protein